MLYGVAVTKVKYTIHYGSVLDADLAMRIVYSMNIGER